MNKKSYTLLKDRFSHRSGTIVFQYNGYDYGLSRDDTASTGIQHTSVSENAEGDTPFFTVPTCDLIEIV